MGESTGMVNSFWSAKETNEFASTTIDSEHVQLAALASAVAFLALAFCDCCSSTWAIDRSTSCHKRATTVSSVWYSLAHSSPAVSMKRCRDWLGEAGGDPDRSCAGTGSLVLAKH